jgi:hypothetical protein
MKAGYDAQLKSIVLIKNQKNTLPIAKGKRFMFPKELHRRVSISLDFQHQKKQNIQLI